MSRFQNGSILKLKRKNGSPAAWAFRWYETVAGKRMYRKKILGTVEALPNRKDAEKAVLALRVAINSGVGSPSTVSDLIAHFEAAELVPERKAFASIETHKIMTTRYIEPTWGKFRLSDVRTVAVEEWLKNLPDLAPASKTKIKSAFSVMYSHAIRHEWVTFNPISKVRTSQKRQREKEVLEPAEFRALLAELSVRDRAMVLLAGSTGLRRSELAALRWSDVDVDRMEVSITKAFVRSRMGDPKTECSGRPVPLHESVLDALNTWRGISSYAGSQDFVFASVRLNGAKPLSPDSLLKKSIKPAVKRAGIDKSIGWHSFRHSLATNLRAMGIDVKVAQELLRHANSRTTMDIYTRAVSSQKRDASARVTELFSAKPQAALPAPANDNEPDLPAERKVG